MTHTDEEIVDLLTELSEIPPAYVLKVTPCDIIVRCPYCGGKHTHGRFGGLGHRVAHCTDMRVDSSKGYFVRVFDLHEELQFLRDDGTSTLKFTGPHK